MFMPSHEYPAQELTGSCDHHRLTHFTCRDPIPRDHEKNPSTSGSRPSSRLSDRKVSLTASDLVPTLPIPCAGHNRYFGSGVILSTSIVHLLEPAADDELGPANTISYGGCISDAWTDYPYAVRMT